eukprot:4170432-Pyramimonas_sp.AAC.1
MIAACFRPKPSVLVNASSITCCSPHQLSGDRTMAANVATSDLAGSGCGVDADSRGKCAEIRLASDVAKVILDESQWAAMHDGDVATVRV